MATGFFSAVACILARGAQYNRVYSVELHTLMLHQITNRKIGLFPPLRAFVAGDDVIRYVSAARGDASPVRPTCQNNKPMKYASRARSKER